MVESVRLRVLDASGAELRTGGIASAGTASSAVVNPAGSAAGGTALADTAAPPCGAAEPDSERAGVAAYGGTGGASGTCSGMAAAQSTTEGEAGAGPPSPASSWLSASGPAPFTFDLSRAGFCGSLPRVVCQLEFRLCEWADADKRIVQVCVCV